MRRRSYWVNVCVVTIRQLSPGSPLPAGEPRRYKTGHGYIRLRWKVAQREYVETYEHRVDGDRVTVAPHVHHRNHKKDDNDPSNLVALSTAEHGRQHRRIDWDVVARMYQAGDTTTAIASALECDAGQVSRILKRMNTPTRSRMDYAVQVTEGQVRRAVRDHFGTRAVAEALGIGVDRAGALMRAYGISNPPGRPPARP